MLTVTSGSYVFWTTALRGRSILGFCLVIRGTLLLRLNKWEIVPGDGPSTPRPDRKAGVKEVVIHAGAIRNCRIFYILICIFRIRSPSQTSKGVIYGNFHVHDRRGRQLRNL